MSKLYDRLVGTTKRLEKTEIIANFLKKTKKEDLENVLCLLNGRVFPLWDNRKIGFSSRLLIKAISSATGSSVDKIERELNKLGDLGDVAELEIGRKSQKTLFSETLTIKKVAENLRKLSNLEGSGSVDRKIGLVAELITNSNGVEAKYISRTVLEVLRVGIADGIIKDAIAQAFDRDIKDVDEAFDILADHGEVALLAKGNKLSSVKLKPGRPLKLMLAVLSKNVEEGFSAVGSPAALEFKYDGFRCITGHTPIYVKDKGLVSVKDVKRGDFVLTHKGRYKKVIAKNERILDKGERIYKLQTFFGNEFKITEKHPILICRGNKKYWMPPESIKKSDELVFPLPKIYGKLPFDKCLKLENNSGYSKEIKINSFFFRFLGYWIGDGFTNDYHNTERVGLVFNAKDKKLSEYYKKGIRRHFGIKNISEGIHNGANYLYWRDKPLRIWLSEHFRREWKGKMLPSWFFGVSKVQFEEFLKGWIESDGHKDNLGRISITTKERDLAMFGQLLSLKFGKMMGLKKLRIDKKTYYRLTIPKSNRGHRLGNDQAFLKLLRFEELKRADPRIRLYNLQIEDDESYCTAMVTLHNCQIHNDEKEIKLFTRGMEDVTKQFPDVVNIAKENIKGKNYIIDCEAVGYDPKTGKYLPFQKISQRIRRKYDTEEMAKQFPVEINAFDLIYFEGKKLIGKTFKERRKLLEKVIKETPKKIVLSKWLVTDDEKKVQKFFKDSIKGGHEGIMFKSLDAPYKPGRYVGYMAKLKEVMDALDLVIVKAEWGEGKRASWLTSYTVACKEGDNFLEVGKVSTGLKEKFEEGELDNFENMTKELKKLIISQKGKVALVKPQIVVEVSYEEIQKSPTYTSGYALRFPRILQVRYDKPLNEIATIKNIEELYKSQNK